MSKKWTHVRISQETAARLTKFMAGLQNAYDRGMITLETRGAVPTADVAISMLLSRHERKQARNKKAQRRKTQLKKQPHRYEG